MDSRPLLVKFICILVFIYVGYAAKSETASPWILIDNFEDTQSMSKWITADVENNTKPYISNPQITERRIEASGNAYLIKKPALDGIVGNRKALTYFKLPVPIQSGEIATFYARFNVERFPNNHIFGLSDLTPDLINTHTYNAFEPSLRITDKAESDGYKNNGTLMVKSGKGYDRIQNPLTGKSAQPLETKVWYQVWIVMDNRLIREGGQQSDVYLQGGEFGKQTKVYVGADYRMKREQDLIYFFANTNTGPHKNPYGNGGVLYDDLYLAKGLKLSIPQ